MGPAVAPIAATGRELQGGPEEDEPVRTFDANTLADALDRLGTRVAARGDVLDIAVYGGSALMLASNFRFASEDVDARVIGRPWPDWLTDAVAEVGREVQLDPDWLNDGVVFHLSRLADDGADHVAFGTFPRGAGEIGLRVFVPTAEYLLALKLKAMRVLDPIKGDAETADIRALMRIVGLATPAEAVALLGRYFPRSAASPEKQLFLLRHILTDEEGHHAPAYPVRSL